jgi:ABC-type nitrate/sulfonate/bicarbonate transport system permease component
VFAGPGEVLRTGIELVEQGQLPAYLSRSLRTLGVCTVIATVIGVPVGIAIGLSPLLSQSVDQTLRFLRNVSSIALIPLFIVWFGIGPEAVYAVVLYTMFIPIIYNSSDGVRSVPRRYGMVVKTLGGSWWHEVKDAYLPGALPGVFVGFKLAISYGWRSAVGAELLLGEAGMGGLLASGRTAGRIDQIILAMIVIGITFVVIDGLVLKSLEQLTSRRWSTR